MSKWLLYIILLVLVSSGCTNTIDKDEAKWQITLSKDDRKPYGAYLAYQSLKYYFPDAAIEPLSDKFRYTGMDKDMRSGSNGRSVMILQGLDFYLSDNEWNALKQYIFAGNELYIFCSRLDKKIQQELNCHKYLAGNEDKIYYQFAPKHDNKDVLRTTGDPAKVYGYEGRSVKGYFGINEDTAGTDNADSASVTLSEWPVAPDTLGYAGSSPDMVRYKLGKGHLTLHAAPLVLSNYFLLQEPNRDYLTEIWKTVPAGIGHIYWQDYYERSSQSSSLDILWRYKATRLALIVAFFTLVLYLLFESKRRQRIIPVIPPLKNDSVSFVETVGRLYYNKGDHANLAEKMVQQFLEWVRQHYQINTNLLNEQFAQQLCMKSGMQAAEVHALMEMIHEIKMGGAKVNDAYLYQLYNAVQQFYKSHSNGTYRKRVYAAN